MAEHEVEALIRERQRLGVGAGGADVEPQPLRVAAQGRDHAGRDVRAGRVGDHSSLQQVEAEVAGPGADLERPVIAVVELRTEQLAQLAEHLRPADLAEVDAPLRVIGLRGDIVVPRVRVSDLIRAAQCLHGVRHITLSPCQ